MVSDEPTPAGRRDEPAAHQRVTVIGASGFVGGHVSTAFRAAGWDVIELPAPRLVVQSGTEAGVAADAWSTAQRSEVDELVAAMTGSAVVVNAAGMAAPTSAATPELWGANAVLPVVLATAAARAGVARFVHVSSAAVQGSAPVLDEQPFVHGHSAYAQSKGAGELALAALVASGSPDPGSGESVPEVVIYRPTSVLAAERPIAARLAAVLRSRWMPLAGGDVALPVAHVTQVADAIVFLATCAHPPAIVVHPGEGMTVTSLATAFGRTRKFISLPRPIAAVARAVVDLLAKGGPVAGQMRRVQLLWNGQEQASSLPGLGFDPGDTRAAFDRLGRELSVHST